MGFGYMWADVGIHRYTWVLINMSIRGLINMG